MTKSELLIPSFRVSVSDSNSLVGETNSDNKFVIADTSRAVFELATGKESHPNIMRELSDESIIIRKDFIIGKYSHIVSN